MDGNPVARAFRLGGAWLERHEKIVVPIAIFATIGLVYIAFFR